LIRYSSLVTLHSSFVIENCSMFLAIDIGNTNITLGLYQGDVLGPRGRFATGHEKTPDEYGALMLGFLRHKGISADNVHAIAMASVVPPLTGTFVEACRRHLQCEPLVVDGTRKTGVRIYYEDPSHVGADRIVDAAAAYRLYGGPACIVDFGTATTFDAISSQGDYLGGAIAPGIGIASEALFQRTAKLPKVDLQRPPSAIGRNTAHSLQSGLLFGYVGLVEGMVARFLAELGPETKVIATGGLAGIVAKETKVISIVAPWLTLDGLRIIYELNTGEVQRRIH
jgi:type III pantothenate kinase